MYPYPIPHYIGPKMGVRLLILAALGLGSLYVIHLLAQDYQKIRKPIQAAKALLNIGKRDLSAQLLEMEKENVSTTESTTTESQEATIDWAKIIKYDTLSCALSLICQLSASDDLKKDTEGGILYTFVSSNINNTDVPSKISKAFHLGEKYNKNHQYDFKKCYTEYPLCPYSAKTMLSILQYYTYYFG
uniref:CSON009836 protein n=1 Tax=Culicoides sonorensis TaxID=179676 RepID=A0A336M0T1_CULSO